MLLKQYEKIGFREFDLIEFRKILGIDDNKYRTFSDFRKRVINTAVREFAKKDSSGGFISDVTFELETIRSNRKISRLRFIIKRQKVGTQELELPMSKKKKDIPAIIAEYESYGINRTITLPHFKKQGEQALIDCLNIFKEKQEKLDMDNPSGYLLGMLNNEAGKKTKAEATKENKKQKDLKAKKDAEYQKKRQEQREKLERTFSKEEITKYLSEFTKEEAEDLLDQAKKESPMLSSLMTSLDSPMCLAFLLPRIPDYEKNKEVYIKKNLKL